MDNKKSLQLKWSKSRVSHDLIWLSIWYNQAFNGQVVFMITRLLDNIIIKLRIIKPQIYYYVKKATYHTMAGLLSRQISYLVVAEPIKNYDT